MILLTKWILAHLIGDFFMQPRKWIEQKEKKTWKAPYLYLHLAVHLVLLIILTGDPGLWYAVAIIVVSHWIIDGLKLQLQHENTRGLWFFIDQILHLLVIVITWAWIVQPDINIHSAWPLEYWLILTAALFLTYPTSYFIQHLMLRWSGDIKEAQSESLHDAGKFIGILERLFIFISVLAGYWQTVGFLLAAKSVFRFGDLTRAKDRKLTEYILIGTLISFGIALAIAMWITIIQG